MLRVSYWLCWFIPTYRTHIYHILCIYHTLSHAYTISKQLLISKQNQLKDIPGFPFSHCIAPLEVATNSGLHKELALRKRYILFLISS